MKSNCTARLATLGLVSVVLLAAACSSSTSPDASSSSGGASGSSGTTGSSGSSGTSGMTGSSSGTSGSSAPPTITSMCAPAKVSYGVATTASVITSSETNTNNVVAVDLNNDGAADLVGTDRTTINVILSKKDGTFGAPVGVPAQVGTNAAMAVADFDGDGNMDVITGSAGGGSVDDSVDVFLGDGKGGFKIPVNTQITGEALFEIIVADFNGDGKPDIYFKGTAGSNGLVLNAGGGKFAGPGVGLPFNNAGEPINFGDFDGDKAADLVFFDSTMNAMCIGKNSGTGSFGTPVCYPATANLAPSFARIADLNGDGKLDILMLNENGDNGGQGINVWMNKGDGTFADRVAYSFPRINSAVALVDVNNDHKPDLVIAETYSNGQLNIIPNNGDGTFTMANALTMPFGASLGTSTTALSTGDFMANGLVGFAALKDYDGNLSVISTTCKP